MRTVRSKGFIFTMVILFLGLMGVVLLVLADGNQTMLSQTDRMYLAAVESNLVASGAAWAGARAPEGRLAASEQATDLAAGALNDRPCGLSVRLLSQSDGQAKVLISTSCGKARWRLTHSRAYTISAR